MPTPPVKDDVMQLIGELRSSISQRQSIQAEPARPEEYFYALAVNGDLVIASFVMQRLAELKTYLSEQTKRDEVAAYLWLQRVQEDRQKTKERCLTMARFPIPNGTCLHDWMVEIDLERKAAKQREMLR